MILTRSRGSTNRKAKQGSNSSLFEYTPREGNRDPSKGVIIFTKHDQRQLQSPNFLNDTIISFFMQYHLDNQVKPELKDKIHVFNSFFFAKIKSIGQNKSSTNPSYGVASRWLKKVKIFSKDFLIMPVCEADHWLLIIVCYPANEPQHNTGKIADEDLYEPAVIVLNSCAGIAPSMKKALSHFLKYQWLQEHETPRNFNINQAKKRGMRLIFPELPQQKNNYNCGVYVLGYFYSFLNDPRQAYIKMFRKQSLKTWFIDNDIDISRERRKMITVINNQITSWKKSKDINHNVKKNARQDEDFGSDEIHITSPSYSHSSIDLVEDEDLNNTNHSVIVIH